MIGFRDAAGSSAVILSRFLWAIPQAKPLQRVVLYSEIRDVESRYIYTSDQPLSRLVGPWHQVATWLDKYKAAEISLLSDLHLFQLYIHALH